MTEIDDKDPIHPLMAIWFDTDRNPVALSATEKPIEERIKALLSFFGVNLDFPEAMPETVAAEIARGITENLMRAAKEGDAVQVVYYTGQLIEFEKEAKLILLEEERDLLLRWVNQGKRELPFELRKQLVNELRRRVQILAQAIWAGDSQRKIRVGEMAEQIMEKLPLLHRRIVESVDVQPPVFDATTNKTLDSWSLPKEQTLKRWLSEIAPEYARKGGRPPQ